jgi:membrane-bound lytic murein transglycosylase D
MKTVRWQLGVPVIWLLLAVCVVSGSDATRASGGTDAGSSVGAPACVPDTSNFPSYPAIEPNVEFWKRVFGEWGLGQVAVHDLDHPSIVYEVVDLPGPIEERYTETQLDFVEDLNELWKSRLRTVADKSAARKSLDEEEKRLALLITTTAGSDAIVDADERIRTQRGLRQRFRRGLEISYRYEPAIREILRETGLPEDLAHLPHVESSYQAAARSSAGAVGVWQFTRGTGRHYLTITSAVDERLDPILAARGAARYLEEAHDRLGDWALALTSYNYGLNGMSRALEKFGPDYETIFLQYEGRYFGFASKNFYSEFLAAREVACDSATYFPEGVRAEPPHDGERVVLEGRTTPGRIAAAYGVPLDELATLNLAWSRRAVRSGLLLPKGSTVWVPPGTLARLNSAGLSITTAWSRALGADGTYVVQRGDTLSTIAQDYGMSVRGLRELNGIPRNETLIVVGQRLRVSDASASESHVVRRGETLSGIANRYGMTLQQLRSVNGLSSRQNLIRPGQRLHVSAYASGLEAVTHVVRRGDTLIRIALTYGVKLADLLLHNGLSERSTIYPGQRIQIPRFR